MFKSSDFFGFARAANVMSTKSQTDFEWSVEIITCGYFCVGIASELQREECHLDEYDKNAILYAGHSPPEINIGMSTVHSDPKVHESGDVFRFRFQPKRKKFLIDLVSF